MNEEQMVELNNKLALGTAVVKFTKADGTKRVMFCTKLESLIPAEDLIDHEVFAEKDSPQPYDLIKVYDLDMKAWRSFRPSRVISF